MTGELAFLSELLPTDTAAVGLLSRVDTHVDLQGGHLVTVSSTQTTAVGALGLVVKLLLHWRDGSTHFFFTNNMLRFYY